MIADGVSAVEDEQPASRERSMLAVAVADDHVTANALAFEDLEQGQARHQPELGAVFHVEERAIAPGASRRARVDGSNDLARHQLGAGALVGRVQGVEPVPDPRSRGGEASQHPRILRTLAGEQ